MRVWGARRRVAFFCALAAAFATCCFFGAEHVQLILFVSGILVYEGSRSETVGRIARHPRAQVIALAALALYLPVSYAILNGRAGWLPAHGSGRYTLQACW